jgi:UPF0716 protein FxsA
MWLFILLVVVPIIEIALFVQVGGAIGLWPTLATVVLTAVIGSVLLRAQGIATLSRLQSSLSTGTNPLDPIANGALILVAGVVLLTPGFFTDAVGFALLIPPVRALVIKWIASRIAAGQFDVHSNINSAPGQKPARPTEPNTVDGDFTVVDEDLEDQNGKNGESGWTKH